MDILSLMMVQEPKDIHEANREATPIAKKMLR